MAEKQIKCRDMFSVAMQGKYTCSNILHRASKCVQGRCKLVVLMEYQSTFFFILDNDHEGRRGGELPFVVHYQQSRLNVLNVQCIAAQRCITIDLVHTLNCLHSHAFMFNAEVSIMIDSSK